MSSPITTTITMIKNNIDDALAIRLLDSVPSDKLHLVFDDKSPNIQKFRHLYNDILSIKSFKYVDDSITDINIFSYRPSDKLYDFLRSINQKKRLNKEIYLDDILELLDQYVRNNNIEDAYDDKLYDLFKDQIDISKYKFLNRFRRALLVTTELSEDS